MSEPERFEEYAEEGLNRYSDSFTEPFSRQDQLMVDISATVIH